MFKIFKDHQRVKIRMGDDVERLNALTEAAAEGKTNDVIKLLEDGIPINGRDGNSKTALYRACCQGKSQTVRELLKRGADCNITSKEELTPLYIGRFFTKFTSIRVHPVVGIASKLCQYIYGS